MAMFRCGSNGGGTVKSTTVTTIAESNVMSVTWDLSVIDGYRGLVLWENLFPAVPAWIGEDSASGGDTSSRRSKMYLTYSYDSTIGSLTATLSTESTLFACMSFHYGSGSEEISLTVYTI